MRVLAAIPGFCLAFSLWSGEPPPPPPTQPATPPLQVTAKPVKPVNPLQSSIDWTQHIADFQSKDAARQEAAVKAFIDGGNSGAQVLDNLARNNPALQKRVTDVKQAIDKRTIELYQEAATFAQNASKDPLSVHGVEAQRQKWLHVAMYSSQQAVRQSAFTQVQNLQKLSQTVSQAQQQLNAAEMQLKGPPVPNPLQRASIQIERANALKRLNRGADALAAARDAVEASGKEGRLTPSALKLQAELEGAQEDTGNVEVLCKRILAEYPRSLEVKFAHTSLVDFYSSREKWDEAQAQAKAFVAAFPIDEDAENSAFGLLGTLMDDAREYIRAVQWADWLIEAFPAQRLHPEAPKNAAGIYEYVVRDFDKAERACVMLRDVFPDLVDAADMARMLERLKKKRDGKWVKEPQPADPDAAGAFAQFAKAVRAKDAKALGALVPKDEVEDYTDLLTDTFESFVPQFVFTDFELKKVEAAPDGNSATLTLALHEPDSAEPRVTKQKALKEDGKWKIQWVDPDEVEEEEAAAPAPQPKKFVAPPQPPPVSPAQPAPAQPAPAQPAPAK